MLKWGPELYNLGYLVCIRETGLDLLVRCWGKLLAVTSSIEGDVVESKVRGIARPGIAKWRYGGVTAVVILEFRTRDCSTISPIRRILPQQHVAIR